MELYGRKAAALLKRKSVSYLQMSSQVLLVDRQAGRHATE